MREQFKEVDDNEKFVHIQMQRSNIGRMITAMITAPAKTRLQFLVTKIKITKTLLTLKNNKVKPLIFRNRPMSQARRVLWARVKQFRDNVANLPEFIVIRAPAVGPVQSIDMRVIPTMIGGKKRGLYIECTPANIRYLCSVAKFEYDEWVTGAVDDVDDGDSGNQNVDIEDHDDDGAVDNDPLPDTAPAPVPAEDVPLPVDFDDVPLGVLQRKPRTVLDMLRK